LALLIIFGGLPGTGKTTLARMLASSLGATYLRIDSIEFALAPSPDLPVNDEGYRVAYAIAEDNLKLGHDVVADSANPVAITRAAWRAIGERSATTTIEIEVRCSDSQEHRKRIEARAHTKDISGLMAPTWTHVVNRHFEPWNAQVVIDTARRTPSDCFADLQAAVALCTVQKS
jgi:predicted kinase